MCSTFPIWATTLSSERWNSFPKARPLLKGSGKRGQIFGDSPEPDVDSSSFKPKSHYATPTSPDKVKEEEKPAFTFSPFLCSTFPIWATTLSSERGYSLPKAQLLLKGRGKRGQIFEDSPRFPETNGDLFSRSCKKLAML
ncbi:hypothetical protein CDAR_528751 [Caerostris darwini]|uniref:Uncharacterized protein n=1 Tax=Caerostris darwini TaxID=1538125 RepID=A0AAV4UNZ8_9ARAC|nr:hypothetical protein CDAR_528751 [Caerostris darwini]